MGEEILIFGDIEIENTIDLPPQNSYFLEICRY